MKKLWRSLTATSQFKRVAASSIIGAAVFIFVGEAIKFCSGVAKAGPDQHAQNSIAAPNAQGPIFQGNPTFGNCNTFAQNSPACINYYGNRKLVFDKRIADEVAVYLKGCTKLSVDAIGSYGDSAIAREYAEYFGSAVTKPVVFNIFGNQSPAAEKKIMINATNKNSCVVTITPSLP